MSAPRVYIYTADVAPLYDDAVYASVYGAVNAARRAKTDRMRFRKDKCLSLGIEYLLMLACRELGIDYAAHSVTADENGKPRFADSPMHFNLSHSGERAMCILSDMTVGCDVEKADGLTVGIADRFFFADEIRALNACKSEEAKNDLFYRLWTLKESFMKCTGLGFRLPLDNFSVSVEGGDISICQHVDNARYIMREVNIDDGYKYAWCLRCAGDICDEPKPVIQRPVINVL